MAFEMITDWADNRDVEVIDLGEELAGVDATKIRVDSFHFNEKGHDVILNILAERISSEYMK